MPRVLPPISVLIATCGSRDWSDLAWSRAYPSVAHTDAEVLVEHDPDATLSDVRNALAERASRPWLVFLDADDELDRDYLDAMTDSIYSGPDPLSARDLHAPRVAYIETVDGMTLENEPRFPGLPQPMPPLNHCVVGTAVRRDLFLEVGGFAETYWPWNDYALWLRCIRAGAAVRYVERAVYRAWVNPESDQRTLTRRQATRLAATIHQEHRRELRGLAQRSP